MNERLLGMLMFFVVSALFWFAGFLNQKVRNKTKMDDHRVQGTGTWVYFLGLRPGRDSVYVRPLPMQVFAIVFFLIGSVSVLFFDIDPFGNAMAVLFLVGLVGFGITFSISDVIPKRED